MKLVVVLFLAAVCASANAWSIGGMASSAMEMSESALLHTLQFFSDAQYFFTIKLPNASSYLSSLTLLQKARAKAGKLTYTIVHKLVVDTLGLAKNIISEDESSKLVACFEEVADPSIQVSMTDEDIDALPINGSATAAAQFKTTIKGLLQLKKRNMSEVLLFIALENSLLDMLVVNAVLKVKGAIGIKEEFALRAVKSALEEAAELIEKLKVRLAGNVKAAKEFLHKVKSDIQDAIAAGGTIPVSQVDEVLAHTLELAIGNDILSNEVALRVSAMINAKAQPQVSEIETLVIGGDATAAAKFKATLKGLILVQETNGVSYESLRTALNAAILNLLAANNIVDHAAAAGLKNFFVA